MFRFLGKWAPTLIGSLFIYSGIYKLLFPGEATMALVSLDLHPTPAIVTIAAVTCFELYLGIILLFKLDLKYGLWAAHWRDVRVHGLSLVSLDAGASTCVRLSGPDWPLQIQSRRCAVWRVPQRRHPVAAQVRVRLLLQSAFRAQTSRERGNRGGNSVGSSSVTP
jgi:hypothetical protein